MSSVKFTSPLPIGETDMLGRIELLKLYSSNQPISFYYWISILQLFDKYKDELDIIDMRLLVVECEECRDVLNENFTDCDKIKKEDTNPDVFAYLEILEAREDLKHTEEYKKESLPTTHVVTVAQ